MIISSQIYTYKDLKEGIDLGKDDYGIAASKCRFPLQQAFSNNPYLDDDSVPFAYIGRVDGNAGGIAMWFPIKLKVGDYIINATSGSTLEVYEEYRKYGIGADIMMYPLLTPGFNFLLYAGVSKQALKIYKKMKFTIFEYPRVMRVCKSRSIVEKYGLHGPLLTISSFICDSIIHIWYGLASLFSKSYRQYKVQKLSVVPEWVNDMVLNDGHDYMEVHDQRWFQWNIDFNLHAEKDDKQSFYGVYKGETPIAFFVTKERFRDIAGGELKNVIIGSVMEWGIGKDQDISEADLYKIAINTFNKKVDIMEFATDDKSVVKAMRKHGFIQHGFSHIIFKDLSHKYKDAEDISKWRIRFGYADVLLT